MTAVRTPVETLRAAAARLEALDKAATPGPWRDGDTGSDTPHIIAGVVGGGVSIAFCPDCNVNGALERPDAALILALRPVAEPLAAWLRLTATWAPASPGSDDLERSLAVARAILGDRL